MKYIMNGITKENPVFVLSLGMCSALAITSKVESAYMFGLCIIIVLLFSNFVVSIIRKIVPDAVRMPVYILIVGTFVTILEVLLRAYVRPLYDALGIYLPLIVVNCVVIGRAITVASHEDVKTSLKDALGMGLGYIVGLVIIALLREFLGSNTITLVDNLSSIVGHKVIWHVLPNTNILPIGLLQQPAGAFIIIGVLSGVFNYWYRRRKNESV